MAILVTLCNPCSSSLAFKEWKENNQRHEAMCEFVSSDNSSCTFSKIMDSFDFHKKLLQLNDSATLNVTKMKFIESFMDNIPRELFIAYPNIELLDVSETNLERLENYDFTYNNHITILNASHNEISKLGFRMMNSLTHLETLDLSHNVIDKVSSGAFTYNMKFKYLNLSHNHISKLDEDFFTPLRSLKVLRLDNNLITEIDGSGSIGSFQLKELYLQHNKLESLQQNMFKSVEILDLSENNLETATLRSDNLIELLISENELKFLGTGSGLKKLIASGNTKKNPMEVQMEYSRNLRYLDFSYSDLSHKERFVENLNKFKSLEYLDLSDIQVEIDQTTFKGLEKLQFLILNGALAAPLPPNAFEDLKNLTLLELSSCHLKWFDFQVVKNSVGLETIKLSRSQLYVLYNWQNLTAKLPKLKEIDIYGNRFSCDDFPNVVKGFKTMSLLLTDMDEYGESLFERDSCIDVESHRAEFSSLYDEDAAFWYIFAFLLLCVAVIGLVFANRRYDLLGRITDIARFSSGRPLSSELLEDE